MGAGKSTLGATVARAARPAVRRRRRRDRAAWSRSRGSSTTGGEAAFRLRESKRPRSTLCARRRRPWSRWAAVRSGRPRSVRALRDRAADRPRRDRRRGRRGSRVARQRPPAGAGRELRSARCYEQRQPLYATVADARRPTTSTALVLAAGGSPRRARRARAARRARSRRGPVALVSDARVAGIHGMDAQLALGRARATHELRPARQAKNVESLERSGARFASDRGGTLVALGGGCTTDVAGFAAATLPARHRLGRRADDARRPGRRGDRRQDRDRPARRQEPRRRVPLAGADGDRPRAARDAAGGRASRTAWPRS